MSDRIDHAAVVTSGRVMDAPTCKLCGAELIYRPDHPGKDIGDWWTHPLIRGELLGHSAAVYSPNGQEGSS